MTSQYRPSKGKKSSIKYWWIPQEVRSFEPDNIFLKEDNNAHTVSHTKDCLQSKVKTCFSGVRTSKLASTVAAGIWDCVGQPAVFQTKASLTYDEIFHKDNIIRYPDDRRKHKTTQSADNENAFNDLTCGSCFSFTAKSNFENLKRMRKILLFASCNNSINNSVIRNGSFSHVDCSGIVKVASIGVSNGLLNTYGSIARKDPFKLTENEYKGIYGTRIAGEKGHADLSDTTSIKGNATYEGNESSGGKTVDVAENLLPLPSSLYSTYSLQPLKSTKDAIVVLRSPSSALHSDNNIEFSTSTDCAFGQCRETTDSCNIVVGSSMEVLKTESNNIHGNSKSLFPELVLEEECSANRRLLIHDKLQKAFSENRHALAGALAGTLVSLCLHPVDMVKTVVQANGMSQQSSYHILKTIISEKGVLGLYRGIASNIASSAPISAIYTYTYESVKGALLPLLPKEYYSLAHCIAGGCSSIATSFIFTPSERIKQQMQVGSQYQNCWNALTGCLEKGGVPSLYAGWGAVLCRNIPHSIIKFYTYETLKQLFSTSAKTDASIDTWKTLVCGGLAGSTAALFTTPFDVVKTRLQTQAPGSLAKYNGVLHGLQEIAREESLQGLYRGLTPRLAMYLSQGAIFFASYEFLKAIFSLEAPRASHITSGKEQKADDPAPLRIQKLHS